MATDTNRGFDGRAVLVTGGGSGIGRACARRLVADGALVTICGRSEARLQAAVTELGGYAASWPAPSPPGSPASSSASTAVTLSAAAPTWAPCFRPPDRLLRVTGVSASGVGRVRTVQNDAGSGHRVRRSCSRRRR